MSLSLIMRIFLCGGVIIILYLILQGGIAMRNRSMDYTALALVIIGAVNWGLIGLFRFNLVATLFGGMESIVSRIIYTLVALAGLYCISLFGRVSGDEIITRTEV